MFLIDMRRASRMLPAAIAGVLLSGCAGQQVLNALTPQHNLTKATNIAYGDHPRQRLDIYSPEDARDAPVVVFFYGGNWSAGSKDLYEFVAQALTSRGFVAVVPDYRLYPEVRFPAFVNDGAAAVAKTREIVHRYGGDPDQLFVMGHSAGAHTAAMLATDQRYLENQGGSRDWLAGFIGIAGPYDFLPIRDPDLIDTFGPVDQHPQSQPVNFVDGGEPPTLLLHGENDDTVFPRNSRDLAQRMAEEGVRPKLVIYPKLGHRRIIAVFGAPLRGFSDIVDQVARFVRAVVDQRRAAPPAETGNAPEVESDAPFETQAIDDGDSRAASPRPEPVEP